MRRSRTESVLRNHQSLGIRQFRSHREAGEVPRSAHAVPNSFCIKGIGYQAVENPQKEAPQIRKTRPLAPTSAL